MPPRKAQTPVAGPSSRGQEPAEMEPSLEIRDSQELTPSSSTASRAREGPDTEEITQETLKALTDEELDEMLKMAEAAKQREAKEKRLMELKLGIAQAAASGNDRPSDLLTHGAADRKFTGHKKKFTGQSAQEYQHFMIAVEADHRYYTRYFLTSYDKIFHAVAALGGAAERHWRTFVGATSFETMLWNDFKEEMSNSLGDAATRDGDTIASWMQATWIEGGNATVNYEYLKGLEVMMPEPLTEFQLFHHFWNITPVVYKERLSGKAKPTTRRDLVEAINQLYIDLGHRKRAAKGESKDNKKFKSEPDDTPQPSNRGGRGGRGARGYRGGRGRGSTRGGRGGHKDSITCDYCKVHGHHAPQCFIKQNDEKKGSLKPGW
jgi:hypothetical protein